MYIVHDTKTCLACLLFDLVAMVLMTLCYCLLFRLVVLLKVPLVSVLVCVCVYVTFCRVVELMTMMLCYYHRVTQTHALSVCVLLSVSSCCWYFWFWRETRGKEWLLSQVINNNKQKRRKIKCPDDFVWEAKNLESLAGVFLKFWACQWWRDVLPLIAISSYLVIVKELQFLRTGPGTS